VLGVDCTGGINFICLVVGEIGRNERSGVRLFCVLGVGSGIWGKGECSSRSDGIEYGRGGEGRETRRIKESGWQGELTNNEKLQNTLPDHRSGIEHRSSVQGL